MQAIFPQEYLLYFKGKWCRRAGKDPLFGRVGCFQICPKLLLALLVGDAAAGLAGRLAGGLALAAAAVLCAVAQVPGLDGLDVFHKFTFYEEIFYGISLARSVSPVNHIFHTFHTADRKSVV